MTLFDEVFDCPKWLGTDDFPSCGEWRSEVEKWIKFASDQGQLPRYKPRLNDHRTKRDEALAEISSAHYLETQRGFKILRWEQKTIRDRDIDFVMSVDSEEIFCEVKSPGWEGELTQVERLSERKDLPKYMNGDPHAVAPWRAVRYAINKSYPKFLESTKNLLVICDDLFLPIGWNIQNLKIALFEPNGIYDDEKGYFMDRCFENVGGVLVVDIKMRGRRVDYRHRFEVNPHAKLPLNSNILIRGQDEDIENN